MATTASSHHQANLQLPCAPATELADRWTLTGTSPCLRHCACPDGGRGSR